MDQQPDQHSALRDFFVGFVLLIALVVTVYIEFTEGNYHDANPFRYIHQMRQMIVRQDQ
jgi:hypothetical protein